jgi:hypothetical protein
VVNIQADTTVLGALQNVLDSQPVSYTIKNDSYGKYVKTIKNDSDSWTFMVWRSGAWVYPQVGMDTFQLQDNDHVVVYSGGIDASYKPTTFIVDSIVVSPEQPGSGEGFSVAVKKAYWDWQANSTVVTPASEVKVNVAGQEVMTDPEGNASFNGLNSGAYILSVTGYGEGSAPKVVRTMKLLNVLPQANGGGGAPQTPYVRVSVTGDEPRGEILPLQKVGFQEGDTPYSVLVRALGEDRVEGKGQGDGIYVFGIDGLREFDKGPQSGWMYAVNCSYPGISAGSYKLKQGDKVDWRYTLNNGSDVKESGTIVCTSDAGNGGVNAPGSAAVSLPQAVLDGIRQVSIGYNNQKPADPKVRTVTVVNPENQMDWTAAMRLKEELDLNQVAIEKPVADQKAVLSDTKEEVTLQIPAQALTEEKTITISELDKKDRKEVLSSLYEFTPHGTKFNKPVYISIKTPLDVNDLESLALAWLNEETNEWIPIPAVVDGATGIVTGAVDHFTKFAVIDKSKLSSSTSGPDVKAAIEAAAKHVLNDSELSDWEAYALAEAGIAVPASYLAQAEKLLQEKNGQLRNVTDYERMALGVKAAGGNARSFAGIDLIEKIYNNERMTVQGTNGPIFALMVLQQGGYRVPDGSKWNEVSLVQWLLEQQNSDGSWSLEKGDTPNVDLTGMALVSLSSMKDRADIKAAADKAVEWLSKQQGSNGGFELSGQENSESAAWVLLALAHLGIEPTDPRFVKAEGNVLTNLLSYQQTDGGFAHIRGESSASIPTEQALLALAVYDRFSAKSENRPPIFVAPGGFADEALISGWALEYVQKAQEYGLMEGIENNRFAPADHLTRAQFVTTLVRLLGEAPAVDVKLAFTDVSLDSWYYGYVAKAVEKGIVNGVTADTFAPDRSISRQEMAIVMARAFELKAASTGPEVYKDINQAYEQAVPSILAVKEHGYMEGDDQGHFAPAAPVTREMTAAVVVRAYEKTKNRP